MKELRCIVCVSVASLALAPIAMGGASSAAQGYSSSAGNVEQQVSQAPQAGSLAATSSGQLPFTGTDLGYLVVGGGALLGAGAALRRSGKRGA